MKKILKNLEPSIRSYLGDAFCFSIIDDVAFDTGWVYDKYIHLEFTPCDGQIKYADYDYYEFVPDQGVFIKSYIEYPYEYCDKDLICGLIMQMIDNDEYCFALWDEAVIKAYHLGEVAGEVYEHGCFVYGYDDEKDVFYSQGYITGDRWEHIAVPYDVFYEALSYCPEKGEIALSGYKVRTDYRWRLDYRRLISNMISYVKNDLTEASANNYDINAERKFFMHLKPGELLHYPSLYCIYEHKAVFVRRIEYLMQGGKIRAPEVLRKIKELERQCHNILLLALRYNASVDANIYDLIFKKAGEMLKLEKDFATCLSDSFDR